jgi:hypothetical protein
MRPVGGRQTLEADRTLIAWAANTLLRQGMPATEVQSVLRADDSETVGRHLELHRERLAEQLKHHLRTVDQVERLLTRGFTPLRPLHRHASR